MSESDFDCDSGNFSSESEESEADSSAEVDDIIEQQILSVAAAVEKPEFEILSPEQICHEMKKSIEEVSSVIQIPDHIVGILLNHFKWDKECLMESFFSDKQADILRQAKVVLPLEDRISLSEANPNYPTSSSPKSESFECDICCIFHSKKMSHAQNCGHVFCVTCWREYLTTKIMDEGIGQSITCPFTGCEVFVEETTVLKLVPDDKVVVRYQHLITNNFVECNKRLAFCPGRDCNSAVKVAVSSAKSVKCDCGQEFCFGCSEDSHEPVRCQMIKQWNKKCMGFSETANWIVANTKDCPNCSTAIEKNGGCNRMLCRKCKKNFCWTCMEPWENHGYNACNRMKTQSEWQRENAQQARQSLERYLFYYNRYSIHKQSLQFESKLYDKIKEKIERAVYVQGLEWSLVQYLKTAVDVLCQCRKTLMNTYVFAFYLDAGNQKEIFTDNQSDLNSAIESLSEYLERDLDAENLAELRRLVMDKQRYCEARSKALLQHIDEGFTQDWWKFVEPK